MSKITLSTFNGIGFTKLLAILFIGLKLSNQIDWSWWWVLSPLWASFILNIILILLIIFSDEN